MTDDAGQSEPVIPHATRALRGITVVELAGHLAGALATRLLAEQGAQVVRVRRPGRDERRAVDLYLNDDKSQLTIDLRNPGGKAKLLEILRTADVVVENFRPGTLERLALGPAVMTDVNPRLVILRLPGFASHDHDWRDVAAWEGTLSAFCGLFTDLNIPRAFLGLPPTYTELPHASVYGAVHGALAVVLALRTRDQTGRGDVVEVPLASAGLSAMGSAAMRINPQPARYDLPEVSALLRSVIVPTFRPLASRLPVRLTDFLARLADRSTPALMDSYRCADGRLLYLFAIDHVELPRRLLDKLGLWDSLQRAGLDVRDPYGPSTRRDNLADSSRLSHTWQRRLRRDIARVLGARAAAEWERQLVAAGIPCAVQRTTSEWLQLRELRAAGIVRTTEVDGRNLTHPGPAVWLRPGPAGSTPIIPPTVVGHDLSPRLAGTVVLDLSSMVAGPVCGRTLAEYGADVIKIDGPHPRHGPRLTCWYGVDVNQGKRSLLLDLRSTEGRQLLDRLIGRADVLVHNFTDAACEHLHLRGPELHAVNPGLIITRIGAFRGPKPGRDNDRRGYDPVLQAASGIMLRYGGGHHPVHHGIASCIDYLTGYMGALATALGLFARQRMGHGCEAYTSLAMAAQLIQLPHTVIAERDRTSPASCPDSVGTSSHIYRAYDGWVFISAPASSLAELSQSIGLDGAVADASSQGLAERIATRLRSLSCKQIRRLLPSRDVSVIPILPIGTRLRAVVENAAQAGMPISDGGTLRAQVQIGPEGQRIETLMPTYARAETAPLVALGPAPPLGADTHSILMEAGLSGDEIEALLSRGIASSGTASELLPS